MASRTFLRSVLLVALVALLPTAALATPLGLQSGDLISSLEWDADKGVSGDGGSFTTTGVNTGTTDMNGRITSVTIQGPVTNPLSDVDFVLNAVLTSVLVIPDFGGPGLDLVGLTFTGVAGDDIVLSDGSGTILTAELDPSGLVVGGLIDTGALVTDPAIANAVDIEITGGDAGLVAALGGVGGTGTLELDGTIFDFDPTLATILANGAIDESFTYSGSGVIQPTAPAPFVPEPSLAVLVLVGIGSLGAASRRA